MFVFLMKSFLTLKISLYCFKMFVLYWTFVLKSSPPPKKKIVQFEANQILIRKIVTGRIKWLKIYKNTTSSNFSNTMFWNSIYKNTKINFFRKVIFAKKPQRKQQRLQHIWISKKSKFWKFECISVMLTHFAFLDN